MVFQLAERPPTRAQKRGRKNAGAKTRAQKRGRSKGCGKSSSAQADDRPQALRRDFSRQPIYMPKYFLNLHMPPDRHHFIID